MKLFGLAAFALFFAAGQAADARIQATPLSKAIEMLSGMLVKAKDQKQQEKVRFAAFKQFCDATTTQKQKAIQEGQFQMGVLKAEIQKYETEMNRLDEEIADHQNEITGWESELQQAHNVSVDRRANYTALHADYTESIDALKRAIKVLKEQAYDRKQAAAMLQKVNAMPRVPLVVRGAISAYLQVKGKQPTEMYTAPEANAYEFQSADIIALLKQLLDKFTSERTELEKEELMGRHASDTLVMDLQNSVKAAEHSISKKNEGVAENKQGAAESSSELSTVSATKEEDDKYLTDLIGTCRQKTDDFDSRQQLRADEIEALEKAIEILSGDSVSGAAAKHLPSLLQGRGKTALAALRSAAVNPSNQQNVAEYLAERAVHLGSHTLSVIAEKVRDDPFGKVKKLIQELIDRLQAEAEEEAQHKAWCDEELTANEQTRHDKTSEVESLHASIDSLISRIRVLEKDIAELTKAVADINAAVAKATELRNTEREDNNNAITDAVEGQTAVSQAITILRQFYEGAAQATALIESKKGKQAPPETFSSPFQGQQLESNNVLAMLDVLKSDFARLEQDTTAAEAKAQQEYEDFMQESSDSKTQKETDIQTYSSEKTTKEGELSTAQENLETAQTQLDAALAYYDKLKPSCLNAGVDVKDRIGRRDEEIASLKEALRLLNGEVLPEESYEYVTQRLKQNAAVAESSF